MYTNVSEEFLKVNGEAGRTFKCRIDFSDGSVLPSENCDIISVKFKKGNTSATDLTAGQVLASAADIEMTYDSSLSGIKSGMTASVSIGLCIEEETEYVPMGVYKVLDGRKNGEKYTLSVSDRLYDCDVIYTSALIYPNNAKNVLIEAANSLGIHEIDYGGLDLTEMKFEASPVNLTCRQVISYIASYFGMNLCTDRNGALKFWRYSGNITVTGDECEEPEIGDKVTVTALACAVNSDNTITAGTGRAVSFSNPYMTSERLSALKDELLPFSYNSAKLNMLVGNILIDPWDILTYNGAVIPAMGLEISFDGGITVNITSAAKSDEEAAQNTVNGELNAVINQVKQYADDAIKHTTDIMNGTKGGYKIEKYDADGNPYETLWMDAPDEETAAHCVVINKNGIGFGVKNSGDTGWTFVYGWTIDGNFNTDYITAHRLHITGSITDESTDKIFPADGEEKKVDLNFLLSSDLSIETLTDSPIDATGLRVQGKFRDGSYNNLAYYTNYGALFDKTDPLTSLIFNILMTGKYNFYGGGGFSLSSGEKNISGSTEAGFMSTEGFFDNNVRCLTENTGVMNKLQNGSIMDCNYPSSEKGRISVDCFDSGSKNTPFANANGYLITAESAEGDRVQLGIHANADEMKIRRYSLSSKTWSAWSGEAAFKNLSASGKYKDTVAYIANDGVMEIGKYIDFHDDNSTQDYDMRIQCSPAYAPVDNRMVFTGGNGVTLSAYGGAFDAFLLIDDMIALMENTNGVYKEGYDLACLASMYFQEDVFFDGSFDCKDITVHTTSSSGAQGRIYISVTGDTSYPDPAAGSGANMIIKAPSGRYLKLVSGSGKPGLQINTDGGGNLNGTWKTDDGVAVSSDINIKNSIASVPDKYSLLFDNLTPVIYKYNNGTSDRYHTGFIAQSVESAVEKAGLSTQDFAGFIRSEEETDSGTAEQCYLRYSEFIALNTNEIQKLKKRVAELEEKLNKLTEADGIKQ